MPLSRLSMNNTPLPGLAGALLLILAMSQPASAATIELASSNDQVTLLELYTSEGCSSCPPADRWLSKLKTHGDLWQKLVPVSFHVDYWNYLGWRDRFSDARYSKRQYNYKRHGYLDVVYTPGLVRNGREYRGWRLGRQLLADEPEQVGVLKAEINDQAATVEFIPLTEDKQALTLNVALLAFDQTTDVRRGENSGRQLIHDFVVIDYQQHVKQSWREHPQWTLENLNIENLQDFGAIALWVTAGNDPTPIQATGGWLKN